MTALHAQRRRVSAPADANASSETVTDDARTIHRAHRYRLYPTADQEATFRHYAGVCRLVFNLALEQRRDFWRQYRRAEGKSISFYSQSSELTLLRAEYDWIAAVSSEATSYALRDLDAAFSAFFSGRSQYPKPRRRDQGHGFRVKGRNAPVTILSARWAEVHIPKLGAVRFRITRPISGHVQNVSVNCTAGAWHVSFATEVAGPKQIPVPGSVGIDLGVARTVTLSTGEHFNAPARAGAALVRAQRKLARMQRGSARHAAQKARIAKLSAKDARRSTDWAHNVTTNIASRFGTVAMEDLNIKNMTASAAGTVEEPGHQVAQKRGLNRAISAQAWGRLTTQLTYKVEERGGSVVFVNPRHTSQTCGACGVTDAKSRASQARFACVHCGHEDNADANAAKEILRRGTSDLGVEADAGQPAKRQPEGDQNV